MFARHRRAGTTVLMHGSVVKHRMPGIDPAIDQPDAHGVGSSALACRTLGVRQSEPPTSRSAFEVEVIEIVGPVRIERAQLLECAPRRGPRGNPQYDDSCVEPVERRLACHGIARGTSSVQGRIRWRERQHLQTNDGIAAGIGLHHARLSPQQLADSQPPQILRRPRVDVGSRARQVVLHTGQADVRQPRQAHGRNADGGPADLRLSRLRHCKQRDCQDYCAHAGRLVDCCVQWKKMAVTDVLYVEETCRLTHLSFVSRSWGCCRDCADLHALLRATHTMQMT